MGYSPGNITDILERITDAFVALDNNWCYTYMNKKAGEIFNRDPAKMTGKHIWTEFPEGIDQPFYKAYYRAMEEQQYIHIEEYYPPYGKWFENHIYPSPEGLSIFFRDITERKKTEEALRKNQRFIESVINASPDIIYIYDIEERKNVYVNEGMQRMLGYTDEEIKQMGEQVLLLLMPKEDFDEYLQNTYPRYATLKDKEILTHEFRMRHKDGNLHWLFAKESIFLRKADGTPKHIFGITNDITESRKAEQALKESEEKFRALADHSIQGIVLIRDNRVAYVNPAQCGITGYSGQELLTTPLEKQFELIHPEDRKEALERQSRIDRGEPQDYMNEIRVLHKDGQYRWLLVSTKTLSLQGKPARLSMMVDITERKKAEEKIKESESKLRRTLDKMIEGVLIVDFDLKYIYLNDNAEIVSQYPKEELIGHKMTEKYPGVEKTEIFKALTKCLNEREPQYLETEFTFPDGKSKWFQVSLQPVEEGAFILYFDITERKKAEQAIKESEEKYRTLVEQASDAIFIADENGKFITVNTSACKLSGFSEKDLLQLSIYDFAIPEDIQKNPFHFDELKQGKTVSTERLMKGKDGIPLHVEINAKLLSDGRLLTFVRDISERKKAENAVIESEARWHSYVNNAPNVILTIDREYKITFINFTLPGYREEEVIGLSVFNFIPDETKEIARKTFDTVIETGQQQTYVGLGYGMYGQLIWYSVNVGPVMQEGKVVSLIMVATDINDRKKTEEQLQKSEELFSGAFHASPAGIIITRIADGKIIDANESFLKMFEFSREEAIGHTSIGINMLSPDERTKLIQKQLESGGLVNHELLSHSKSGKPINLLFSSKQLRINDEPCHITTLIDITERKKAEETLRAQHEELKNLYATTPVGLALIDRDMRFLRINELLANINGKPVEAHLGRTIAEVLPELADVLEPIYRRVLDKGEPVLNVEIQGTTPSAQNILRYWLASYNPVYASDGSVTGVSISVIEITERKQAEAVIIERERQLSTLINNLPGTVYRSLNDKNYTVEFVSEQVAALTGYPASDFKEHSRQIGDMIHPEDQERVWSEVQTALAKKQPYELTYRLLDANSREKWVWEKGSGIFNENGELKALEGFVLDITERKKVEESLRKSQELFEKTFHSSPISTVLTRLQDRTVVDVNEHFEREFGYGKSEVVGRPVTDIELWDDPLEREKVAKILVKEGMVQDYEFRYKTKSGTVGYGLFYSEAFGQYDEKFTLTKVVNITERKKAEEEIKSSNEKLRQLTAHLQAIREEERKRISREIHDELGQQLTAIKMDVAWIDKKIPGPSAGAGNTATIKDKLKNINTLLDGSNLAVRKILSELRPGGLEDHSLTDVLKWQGHQFTQTTGIPVEFTASGKIIQLPEQIATCIFRVYQESLTNIMRHANANKILTSLKFTDDSVVLTIKDNGKGFDIKSAESKKSFGILGMKERVHSLNGKFELVSAKGKGTKIVVSLPYKG